jgi:hypothetical protein
MDRALTDYCRVDHCRVDVYADNPDKLLTILKLIPAKTISLSPALVDHCFVGYSGEPLYELLAFYDVGLFDYTTYDMYVGDGSIIDSPRVSVYLAYFDELKNRVGKKRAVQPVISPPILGFPYTLPYALS